MYVYGLNGSQYSMFQLFEEILKHFIHKDMELYIQKSMWVMNAQFKIIFTKWTNPVTTVQIKKYDILSTNQGPCLLPPFHLLLTKSIVTSLTLISFCCFSTLYEELLQLNRRKTNSEVKNGQRFWVVISPKNICKWPSTCKDA